MNKSITVKSLFSKSKVEGLTEDEFIKLSRIISLLVKKEVQEDCNIFRCGVSHAMSILIHFKMFSDDGDIYSLDWISRIDPDLEVQCVGQAWNNPKWIVYSKNFNGNGFKEWVKGAPPVPVTQKLKEKTNPIIMAESKFGSSKWLNSFLGGSIQENANCIHATAGDPYLQSCLVSKSVRKPVAWVTKNLSEEISSFYEPITFSDRIRFLSKILDEEELNKKILAVLYVMPAFALENYNSYEKILSILIRSWPRFHLHLDSGWNADPTFFLLGKIKKIPTYGVQHGGGPYLFKVFNKSIEFMEYDKFYYFWPSTPYLNCYRYDRRISTLVASTYCSFCVQLFQHNYSLAVLFFLKNLARISAFIFRSFVRNIRSFIYRPRPLIISGGFLSTPVEPIIHSIDYITRFNYRFHPIDIPDVKKNQKLKKVYLPTSHHQSEPRIESILWGSIVLLY